MVTTGIEELVCLLCAYDMPLPVDRDLLIILKAANIAKAVCGVSETNLKCQAPGSASVDIFRHSRLQQRVAGV